MPEEKEIVAADTGKGKKASWFDKVSDFDIKRVLGFTKTVMILRIATLAALFALFVIAIVMSAELRSAQVFFSSFFRLVLVGVAIYAVTEIINKPKNTDGD